MPNETDRYVHRIVTPGQALLTTETVFLSDLRWISPLAVKGDQAVIEDAAGHILWESIADAENYVERDYIGQVAIDGYKVPALDSGTLYIRVGQDWEVIK